MKELRDDQRRSPRLPAGTGQFACAAMVPILAGALSVIVVGISVSGQQKPGASGRAAANASAPRVDFIDVAARAGLTAKTEDGGEKAKKYIVETTGSGAAFIDYDNDGRSEEHTSELQSLTNLVCRLLLEK